MQQLALLFPVSAESPELRYVNRLQTEQSNQAVPVQHDHPRCSSQVCGCMCCDRQKDSRIQPSQLRGMRAYSATCQAANTLQVPCATFVSAKGLPMILSRSTSTTRSLCATQGDRLFTCEPLMYIMCSTRVVGQMPDGCLMILSKDSIKCRLNLRAVTQECRTVYGISAKLMLIAERWSAVSAADMLCAGVSARRRGRALQHNRSSPTQ